MNSSILNKLPTIVKTLLKQKPFHIIQASTNKKNYTMTDIRDNSYKAFDQIYEQVKECVKKIQGEKPYVETQNNNCDRMYLYAYEQPCFGNITESPICGIRINNGKIEVVAKDGHSYFETGDFETGDFDYATKNYDEGKFSDDFEWCWQPILQNDVILAVPTLFSIAEVIEEYFEEEQC